MPLKIMSIHLVWDTKENPFEIRYFDWLLGHNPFTWNYSLQDGLSDNSRGEKAYEQGSICLSYWIYYVHHDMY